MNNNKFAYFDKVPAQSSPAGNRFEPECKVVREDNNLSLVEIGKIDLQEQISSYEDGVSLPRMIARYQAGDTSVFSGDSGFYGDVSEMPLGLQEAIYASRKNYETIQSAVQQVFAEKQKAAVERSGDQSAADQSGESEVN